MESALSIKGQATIPKAIREHLGLASGDWIKFFVHPDGSVVILPKVPTSALKGILRLPKRRFQSRRWRLLSRKVRQEADDAPVVDDRD